MAQAEWSIVEMGIKKDLDYIIDDLNADPVGGVTAKSPVCGVPSVPAIRHVVPRGQSTAATKRKQSAALSAQQLTSLERKASAALRIIRLASASVNQVQSPHHHEEPYPDDPTMSVSSSSPHPQRHASAARGTAAEEMKSTSTSPAPPRKKKQRDEKPEGKKRRKSKTSREEEPIFKADEDWIQGIEVRRPSPHRARAATISGPSPGTERRRGSRHFDDLVGKESLLENLTADTSKPISKTSRSKRNSTPVKPWSRTDGDGSSATSWSHGGNTRSRQRPAAKSAEAATQTAVESDHLGEEDNGASVCHLGEARMEIEELKRENECLRKQLEEAVDWEVQVMMAYKSLAEKHHHHRHADDRKKTDKDTTGTEHKTRRNTEGADHKHQGEIPSLQQMSSNSVADHAGHYELPHPVETTLQAGDTPGHEGTTQASHTQPQASTALPSPSAGTGSADAVTAGSHQDRRADGGRDDHASGSGRARPRLVKSHSSSFPLAGDSRRPGSPGSGELSRKRATSVTTQRGRGVKDTGFRVVSALRVNVEEDNRSNASSIYEQFEISGDRHDMRFPWQHDVPVQCDRVQTREVSIQTDFEPCSQCRLRRLSDCSEISELDSASNYAAGMRKRSSAISSSNRSTGRPRLQRQNFSLDLSDCSHNGGLPNGLSAPGSPPGPIRYRSTRLSAPRPLSDSDISRTSSMDNSSGSRIFQRRKNADVTAAKCGITVHLTVDEGDPDSLPCSPCPSPIPQELDTGYRFRSRPKVIVTHHDDPSCDAQSQRSSSNGSQDSLTSDSSSLRVPSPEFLRTKAVFKKDSSVSSAAVGSDTEDEEPTARPPTSRIYQRRGAVISQAPPNASDCGDDDGGGSGISGVQETGAVGSSSPPHHGDLLFPPSIGNEHRCSIMSTASSTLASVAAVHLQDFIEASATAGYDCNGLDQDNTDGTETKKKLHALFKKKFGKDKDKSMIDDITTVFTNFKIRDQDDFEFATYKDKHWRDVITEVENNNNSSHLVQSPSLEEVKRRDKVWELFRSECVYLIEHILVLKNVFQEPLRALQCEGHLMYIEPAKIFANLDELSQVSASFCRDLIRIMLTKASRTEFCHTDAVVTAFAMFGNRVCPAYQRYCMNYSGALHYIETLKKHEDFVEFVKLCEQDSRCKRLQLADLMVAPIQHVTKYPLLLKDIRERTEDSLERASLNTTLQAVEVALNELDGKVKWLGNFERLRELQQMISWPQADELDSKAFVPEFLKDTVAKMSKSNLLASTKRTLLHEGPLTMIDGTKSLDMYVFLFDDMLLISKIRKNSVKKKSLPDGITLTATPPVPRKKDGFSFMVHKPPIPLDRVAVVEIESKRAAASGLKHGFALLQNSRYQQFVGAYTLVASDESSKQTWLAQLKNAREKWVQMLRNDEGDDFANDDMRRDRKRTL